MAKKVYVGAEKQFSSTQLLLHGEDFTDHSIYNHQITNDGVTVSTAQSKFGGSSLYFNGSAKLTLDTIDFGNNDFTIDWWEYVTSSSSKARFCNQYTSESLHCGGLLLGYQGTMVYASSTVYAGNTWELISGKAMLDNTLNTWVHWAFVRNGNTLTSYKNGQMFAQYALTGSIAADTKYPSVIGDYRAGDTAPFIGYIDEFRISNVARWTANFAPPTAAYDSDITSMQNVANSVKDIYLGADIARCAQRGYIGTNDGIARQFWAKNGSPLGSLTVGQSVFMNVDGVSTEFIVVNQGLPSSDYDASCDGTWLLMKDIHEKRTWDGTNNEYANSDIHAHLNETFLKLLDPTIQNVIKQVKIPYTNVTGSPGSIATGANGLSTKIFLLSLAELGITDSATRIEGTTLDYFNGVDNSARVAYFNNSAAEWWLRTPDIMHFGGALYSFSISPTGAQGYVTITLSLGVRPCLVMPSDATIDSNGNVIPPPAPPATLGNLSAGDSVFMNVDGVSTEFIVVNQGLPSSDYDTSCDGTWLLMKDLYTNRAYTPGSTVKYDYETSDINSYLNGTLLNLFDPTIKAAIKQAKIPYCKFTTENYDGASTITIKSGSNGLSTKLFLLSLKEVGFNYSTSQYSSEGAVLDYFDGAGNADRKAYYNGTAKYWWLRSCKYSPLTYSAYITNEGSVTTGIPNTTTNYIRPCLILPSDTGIDSNYNVTPPPLPTTLGELNVGDTVYMNVNGISTEFIAVNQGLPSSDYDSSCDGTWLLMKDCYENRVWDATNNDYANSDIHAYLNGTFLGLFDFALRGIIKQAKIPYSTKTGSTGALATGANGLSAKIFLLSLTEIGLSASGARVEGAVLGYFNGTSASTKIAYLNGTATNWKTRSPFVSTTSSSDTRYWYITTAGATSSTSVKYESGIRPCIILPSTTGINESFTVTPPPVTVNTLSVGDTVKIKVNGVATEFIIVNKGRPSTKYDTSCNGVWCLMKDIYTEMQFNATEKNTAYAESDIHTYLNGTFFNLIDNNVSKLIKQVKIPYTKGKANLTVYTGSNGLSTKVFLLSAHEVCDVTTNDTLPCQENIDGSLLSYFDTNYNSDEKLAYYNGTAKIWYLRTASTNNLNYVMSVSLYGDVGRTNSNGTARGVRPCFILPTTAVIDENNNIIG